MNLYCDNKATISISHIPVQHYQTKHLEVDWHFIREKLLCGLICTAFVTTNQQLADVLTKGVTKVRHHDIISKFGMTDIHAPTWGGVLKSIGSLVQGY